MKLFIVFTILFQNIFSVVIFAQPERWQQAVKYDMTIDFDTQKHQYDGFQVLQYSNNSPDTLDKVFYHLYFNAFQPNSMMDVRSRTIPDPDKRIGDRIEKLEPDEQGFIQVNSLKMNGKKVAYKIVGTILEVKLNEPILPNSNTTFEMNFKGQVPVQIRRSGRFNSEGIEYSMAQWYPKMCNYDYQGWHANPYIAREFYGIWGDFDVKINLPSKYVIAATGILQNTSEIGFGYSNVEPKHKPDITTWHFIAKNVHDFVWAADPDYRQIVHKNNEGVTVRYFFQPGEGTTENWEKVPEIMDEVFTFANDKFGKYPFDGYSFIQGGDGGMEYPMATLITGNRTFISLVGVCVHELMHSWFQTVLGSNESLYPWMDEGFASFAASEVMNHLKEKKLIPGEYEKDPHLKSITRYIIFALSGREEPLTTHADHFTTNSAYGTAAYTKGEVLLEQLRYILGDKTFDEAMLRYFNTWKFKHPNANDFFRVMEKQSGLELDWFREYFVNTIYTIDYEIEGISGNNIVLKNNGLVPMPLDITVTAKNGKIYNYYIPQEIMRGEKNEETCFNNFKIMSDWAWTDPTYQLKIDQDEKDIISIEIDSSKRMADINRFNNIWPRMEKTSR